LKTRVLLWHAVLTCKEFRFYEERAIPDFHSDYDMIAAEGDFLWIHGRYSGRGEPTNWIAVDIFKVKAGVFVEHRDVLQDEVSKAGSVSGLPMFGESFSY
jgi:predicted SnoaL-like aldol condensation-catalyzing enzyme